MAFPSQWLFIGLQLLSEVLNSIFGSVLRLKKQEKWPKPGKNRASLSSHNISQNLHRYISLCMGYPAGELLVLGWELLFQALCHSSTVLEVFKGPKIYGST